MKHLSDQALLGQLRALKKRECETSLIILRYLDEVDQRKLYLKLGYASLFAFATRHLRYSESAAGRRIQAARCLRKHPEMNDLLERDEVNLTTIALVSRILNDTNKHELLARIRNKSQREVEAIVVTAKPATRVRDRVKAVNVAVADPPDAPLDRPAGPLLQVTEETGIASGIPARAAKTTPVPNGTNHSRRGSDWASNARPAARGEQQFMLQFAARGAFMQKFEEARALLSGRFPKGAPFAEVFEAALDALLEKKSPMRRKARREERAARREAREAAATRDAGRDGAKNASLDGDLVTLARERARPAQLGPAQLGPAQLGRAHIPRAVRDAVFTRDGGCCTFVGLDGQSCSSRHDLEVDHKRPLARGGSNAVDNLRLLCARHNLLEAERVYGTKWMRRFLVMR